MPIRFGILGCGFIAQRHAQHISSHADAEIAAAYDIRPGRADALCARYGGSSAPNLDSFLDLDFDIVSICTPNGFHCEGAVAALSRGKHVLVEKPMALSVAQCERMLDASLRHTRQLFIVKQNRYNPPVQALKRCLEAGQLGRVYAFEVNCFWNRSASYYEESDWKGRLQLDGGTLFTQFSHFVDILYYLLGDVDVLSGTVANVAHAGLIEFEDTGFFTLRSKAGALGSFNYSTAAFGRNMEGSITVFAERGTVKVGGQYLNVIDYEKTATDRLGELPPSAPPNEYGTHQGSMSNHDKVIANVVETLRGRDLIMANALDGLKAVDIIERMYRLVR